MLDVQALKAEMVRNGYTQETLSKELGMTSRTFQNRLKAKDFGLNEIDIMVSVLKLKNPLSIFFPLKSSNRFSQVGLRYSLYSPIILLTSFPLVGSTIFFCCCSMPVLILPGLHYFLLPP